MSNAVMNIYAEVFMWNIYVEVFHFSSAYIEEQTEFTSFGDYFGKDLGQ